MEFSGFPRRTFATTPIGFGLDESALDSICKATFAPAINDGKPVPVLLELVVAFHIYSKRSAVAAPPQEASDSSAKAASPGPYSVQHK